MKKKFAVVLALSVAPLVLSALPANSASTYCQPGNPGRTSCRTIDGDGIKRIRVIDTVTGNPVIATDGSDKVLHFDCSVPTTDKRYSFADNGNKVKIQVFDCLDNKTVTTYQS